MTKISEYNRQNWENRRQDQMASLGPVSEGIIGDTIGTFSFIFETVTFSCFQSMYKCPSCGISSLIKASLMGSVTSRSTAFLRFRPPYSSEKPVFRMLS